MIYDDTYYIYTHDHMIINVCMYDYHQYITMCTMPTLNLADWQGYLKVLVEPWAKTLRFGGREATSPGLAGGLFLGRCSPTLKTGVQKMSWEMNTMMVFKQENMGIIGDVEVMAYHRCHHRSEIRWSVGDSPHYDSAFSGLRWFPHCPWFKPIWIAKMEIGWTIPKCLKPPNSYHTYSTLPFHIVVQSPFLLVVTSPFRSHFFGWLLPVNLAISGGADHLRPQAYHIGGYISHYIPIVVGLFWLSNPGSRAFWFVKKIGAPRMVYGFVCAYSSTWC